MEDTERQSTLDDFAPRTRLQFPDGARLVVGTKRDDDDPLQYGVNLVYNSGRNAEPEMNILLPPHSIDVLIPILQARANEARYIMGGNVDGDRPHGVFTDCAWSVAGLQMPGPREG